MPALALPGPMRRRPRRSAALSARRRCGRAAAPAHVRSRRSSTGVRTEERPRPLEHRDLLQLLGGRRLRALRMIGDGGAGLRFEAAQPSVVHQHRIERGRVQRAGNAAADHHRSSRRVRCQADVVGERHPNEQRGIRQHPLNALTGAIVAAVAEKQRIVGIAGEALLRLRRRHGAGATAVAGQAGAAVAAERLALEGMAARVDQPRAGLIVICRQARAEGRRDHQCDECAGGNRLFAP